MEEKNVGLVAIWQRARLKIGNSITHFNMVVPVIMQIKNPVNLTVS